MGGQLGCKRHGERLRDLYDTEVNRESLGEIQEQE